jgi:hypothetical protein
MRPTTRSWLILMLTLTGTGPAAAGEPPSKKSQPPRAPADYTIFEDDQTGAYFIARPLKERYDELRSRVASLRAAINDARIDPVKARAEIDQLQQSLATLLEKIEQTRIYIPGATIHKRTETAHLAIKPDDLILIDASNVEIRGWDGPDIQAVLDKTVLDDGSDDGPKIDAEFAAITLENQQTSGKQLFGFYIGLDKKPAFKTEWDHFIFRDYLDREFVHLAVKGVLGAEGNRQISMKMINETGQGSHASQWRRHVTVTLLVPKCRGVGVRGGLGRLKVRDLAAPLFVLGEGDRDYNAQYELTHLGGRVVADNIPIHRIDGVAGNVSVVCSAYPENRSHGLGPDGEVAQAFAPKDTVYRGIEGDLTAHFCRANLTVEDVGGRVDIENDFGPTAWRTDRPLAPQRDHRLVTQSGTVEIRFGSKILGTLPLRLYTECGTVRLTNGVEGFEESMFTSSEGDVARRSWECLTRKPTSTADKRPDPMDTFALFSRVADTLHGRPRTPGVDVISRAGTVSVVPGK